ncbi:hypothetical protein [Candidatus Nitrosocosmicus hydrocola]|jgi:hypothetical protein|uniref:hypothetical protein n=1 Tax=Candidatus Nitrosocosmicus hydrocola TaxID=1826872 RepID=UPI0011E59729|nr:hypothetical protein [Candidatus Nitrosocosmicus hydrocola]
MNISISEPQLICEAKVCGCNNNKIVYGFAEPVHSLYIDKKQLILLQIQACRNLLKHTLDILELDMIKNELDELNALYQIQ